MEKLKTTRVKRPLRDSDLIQCDRCGKLEFAGNAGRDKWNIVVKRGYITGYLCHECQTVEEDIEAEVNMATIEYGADSLGRLTGRPKGAR